MEFLFPYHKSVFNPSNIIQKGMMHDIEHLLSEGGSVAYISAPKTGKKSIINCALKKHCDNKTDCIHAEIDLLKFFSRSAFLRHYKSVFRCVNDSLNERAILPLIMDFDKMAAEDVINLPEIISKSHNVNIVVVFYEFQQILSFDNCDDFLYEFEKSVVKHKSAQYIFSGSMINKMKFIFKEYKFFFNFATVINIPAPTREECYKYLEGKFMRVGKEIGRNITDMIYDMCGGHPWYVMHLASICHSITPGYVTSQIVNESMERLISTHDIRFKEIISNLTENQFNLIMAVLDGVKQFSSAESISKYNLHSSAQIARSRDALMKKEVITINDNGETSIIDPLFEYWLRNCYLSKN